MTNQKIWFWERENKKRISAETNIIDCRHLNERLWIKIIAQSSTVACVGKCRRRIIRHEYSASKHHSRSPLFTGQSSTAMYGYRARQEIRHRNLSRFPTLKSIGKCVKKSDIGSSVTGEIGTWRDWLNKERGDNCLKFQFPVKSSNVWRRLSSLQNFPKKGSKGLAFFLVVWQIYTFIQILMLDRFACFGLFLN